MVRREIRFPQTQYILNTEVCKLLRRLKFLYPEKFTHSNLVIYLSLIREKGMDCENGSRVIYNTKVNSFCITTSQEDGIPTHNTITTILTPMKRITKEVLHGI